MAWEIVGTSDFEDWYLTLDPQDAHAVTARIDLLEQHGPALKRPVVGEIKGSENDPRMKELRCGRASALRVLFIFDPARRAVLLIGGAKAGQWNRWYREAIPKADRLYREYLAETNQED
jgi:hypothetical protein